MQLLNTDIPHCHFSRHRHVPVLGSDQKADQVFFYKTQGAAFTEINVDTTRAGLPTGIVEAGSEIANDRPAGHLRFGWRC